MTQILSDTINEDAKNYVNAVKLHPTEVHQWVAKARQLQVLRQYDIRDAILIKQKFEYMPEKQSCRLYCVYDVPYLGRIMVSSLMDVRGTNTGGNEAWFNQTETLALYDPERNKYRNLHCRFGERFESGEISITDGLCDNDKFFAGMIFRDYAIDIGIYTPTETYQ